MKSPYGRRGAICAHLHWTYHYLIHQIPWATVQRIMADLPQYNYDNKTSTHIPLSPDNSQLLQDQIAKFL